MEKNNIFTTNYSTSNPFSMDRLGQTSSSLDSSLAEAYQRLEEMKKKQAQYDALQQAAVPTGRTVFTDIADELRDLPEDEIRFITASEEYQKLNIKYQNEFSQFLTNKFAVEYLQSGNQRTLEDILGTIKNKKEEYKHKFANEINEIRDQNKELAERNNQLAASNEELQKQLKEIQSKLL